MAGLLGLFYTKWNPPADPTSRFTNKTIIITGSNTGLGYEAAVKLASLGCQHLILGVRNLEQGKKAQTVIQRLSAASDAKVEVWHLDMSSYDSIKAFAARADRELDRLDAAVINAGVINVAYQQSEYGWERMLQVNSLSTVLLGLLLMPKLRASRTGQSVPVLEMVSSGTAYSATLTEEQRADDVRLLDEWNKKEEVFNGRVGYRNSKLILQAAVDGLMRQAQPLRKDVLKAEGEKPDVWVTTVCPGACRSSLGREYTSIAYRIAIALASFLVLRTTEEGSRTLISGLTQGEKGHGRLWQHDVMKVPIPILEGEEGIRLKQKIWNEMIDALRKDVPEVMEQVRHSQ